MAHMSHFIRTTSYKQLHNHTSDSLTQVGLEAERPEAFSELFFG